MTFRHGDVFDKYYGSGAWYLNGDIYVKWPQSPYYGADWGGSTPDSATPYGTGASFIIRTSFHLSANYSFNDRIIYFSVATTCINNGNQYSLAVSLMESNVPQVTIEFVPDGSINVHSGPIGGAVVGSGPANTFNRFLWTTFQVRVIIGPASGDASAGSITIRTNSSTVPILSLTNINTMGGTTNAYINGWSFASVNSIFGIINSPILWSEDSVSPNGWMGEVRGTTNFPHASVQSQFSVTGAANNVAALQPTEDLAASYISTTIAGHEDIVSLTSLPSITGSYNIIGVQPFVSWARGAVGLATAGFSISDAGATYGDTSLLTNNNLSPTYQYQYAPFAIKNQAATPVVWTESSVNNIQLGVSKIA